MSMAAKLQMRQSQGLAVTPQLLQSIRLLQLSHLELERFIADEVEKNPLLSRDASVLDQGTISHSDEMNDQGFESTPRDLASTQLETSAAELSSNLDAPLDNVFADDGGTHELIAPDLAVQWKNTSNNGPSAGSNSVSGGASGNDWSDILEQTLTAPKTLKSVLEGQIPLLRLSLPDVAIAASLLDCLDENGYLTESADTLADQMGVETDMVNRVLDQLQMLEPYGVFARDLADCLALQLRVKDRLDPAMQALLDHLPMLAKRDFKSLEAICGVNTDDLLDMLSEIRNCDPKPGAAFAQEGSEPVVPDVLISTAPDGSWKIELNPAALPRVLVDRDYYATVLPHCRKDNEREFMTECLQSAGWLERSLDQRAKTILKVATEIIRQQDGFLTLGVNHLRPMSLRSLAEKVGMHESTISRVTMNKFMHTPRGLFELRYFFTISIASADGSDAHSAESVRHKIKALIDAESVKKVLSDDAIVDQLRAQKIDIARRTVAKYRESLNIPSSVERRREKRAMSLAV